MGQPSVRVLLRRLRPSERHERRQSWRLDSQAGGFSAASHRGFTTSSRVLMQVSGNGLRDRCGDLIRLSKLPDTREKC